MKLNELAYAKWTELDGMGGAYIRNLPMKDYQLFLAPVMKVTNANKGLEKKLANAEDLTEADIEQAEDMSKDFLPAVNDFIKGVLCDEHGDAFDDDDIFDVLPQHIAMDMFQAAAAHIAGKKGN